MEMSNFNTIFTFFSCRRTKICSDERTKSKWMRLKGDLLNEFQLVKDLSLELASFKVLQFQYHSQELIHSIKESKRPKTPEDSDEKWGDVWPDLPTEETKRPSVTSKKTPRKSHIRKGIFKLIETL